MISQHLNSQKIFRIVLYSRYIQSINLSLVDMLRLNGNNRVRIIRSSLNLFQLREFSEIYHLLTIQVDIH